MAWFDSGRAHASAEDSKRSSKAHWVGSIPTGSTTPRSTSGEVIGFSSRSDGLDTHTRCHVSAGGSGGLATNEARGGSTPPRDSTCSRQRIWRRCSERRTTQFDSARGRDSLRRDPYLGSSNGRTRVFGARHRGSNPRPRSRQWPRRTDVIAHRDVGTWPGLICPRSKVRLLGGARPNAKQGKW